MSRPRVVVCRSRSQSGPLIADLEAREIAVVAMPLIEVAPPRDPEPLRQAVASLDSFDWIAFTSTNAVAAVADIADHPRGLDVAVVGDATAQRARAAGWEPSTQPQTATAAALAEHLLVTQAPARLLAPLAELASDDLTAPLSAEGWQVTRVDAYRTRTPTIEPEVRDAASSSDLVAITSGSIAQRLVDELGIGACPPVVCIGPSSARSATQVGLDVVAVAQPHDRHGLVEAVAHSLPR